LTIYGLSIALVMVKKNMTCKLVVIKRHLKVVYWLLISPKHPPIINKYEWFLDALPAPCAE
jgi:hypothetical protein